MSAGVEQYQLDFDDPVTVRLSHALTIAGTFDADDEWTITSAGVTFTVNDPGTPDLTSIINGPGMIVFNPTGSGDGNWSITSTSLNSISLLLSDANVTLSNLNVQAEVVAVIPEPGALGS